jgi:hypothetical protein
MRIALIVYFWVSGLFMVFFGAKEIAVPVAHLGQPVSSLLRESHMEAVAAGDVKRKEELDAGIKYLDQQLDVVRGYRYSAPYFLAGFGLVHCLFGAVIMVAKKKADPAGTDNSGASRLRV